MLNISSPQKMYSINYINTKAIIKHQHSICNRYTEK